DAREIVGKHAERHLGGNLWQRLHQEVCGTHPHLQRSERMLDCLTTLTHTQPFDAAFVAVKSYDTEWATALVLPYVARPDGVVVDFQNGINDERVAAVAGRERTLGCVILIA